MLRTFLALVICGAALAPPAAFGQTPAPVPAPAAAGAPTPAEAQRVLTILQDPQQLARLIETLQTIAAAAPGGPGAEPAAPTPAPGIAIAPHSLGAQLLAGASRWTGRLSAAAAATVAGLNALPALWHSLIRMSQDPATRAAAEGGGWRIILVLLCSAAAELACRRALRRTLTTLAARAPRGDPPDNAWESLRLLPYALTRLVLELIPLVAFAVIGNLLAGGLAGSGLATPLTARTLVNAYALARAVLCGGRMLASPGMVRLRLLPVGDAAAASLIVWLRWITLATVGGNALAAIVLVLGLSPRLHDALTRLTALAAALVLVAAVIHFRRAVAVRIRGTRHAGEDGDGRRSLAETWHYLAIAAIVVAWLISVGAIGQRLDTLDFLLGTAGVLAGAWLAAIVALGALARAMPRPAATGWPPDLAGRAARYHRIVRGLVIAVVAVFAGVALLQFWGADAMAWFAPGAVGRRLVAALITVALAAAIAIIVWEGVNLALDREVDHLRGAEPARAARLRTLLPIARTTLLATILIVIGATALSEVGISIAPLLAGAGIVGIAVGFGAQTLVRDIITGIFILIENTIQVGDGVTVAGLTGAVEQLSLRTLRLRAGDGSLHIIPFSSVVTITNTNRGVGNAAVSVMLAVSRDVDRAIATLETIGAELRADATFAPMILGDLAVWGVDSVSPAGITITGQLPCTVAGKMPVQREFNRRMLHRFAAEHIALAVTMPDLPFLRRRFVPQNERRFW
ncbi:MAG TPA: mechanosensitive ion channel domain-containing protein [Stellaceae bacterium]|nr:mechanosensitive ion channel domain-containing protein [Stellaceae bacterium]